MAKLIATLFLWMFAACSASAQPQIQLQKFEPDSLARILAQHKGKPFVLIIWSLDCEYCQASLKALADAKRKGKTLNVVSLATDSADDPQAYSLMQKRLASLGLARDAWAFGSAPAEQLRYALDPQWHGEMPRTYWFNARGEKRARSGVLTAATIAELSSQMKK